MLMQVNRKDRQIIGPHVTIQKNSRLARIRLADSRTNRGLFPPTLVDHIVGHLENQHYILKCLKGAT